MKRTTDSGAGCTQNQDYGRNSLSELPPAHGGGALGFVRRLARGVVRRVVGQLCGRALLDAGFRTCCWSLRWPTGWPICCDSISTSSPPSMRPVLVQPGLGGRRQAACLLPAGTVPRLVALCDVRRSGRVAPRRDRCRCSWLAAVNFFFRLPHQIPRGVLDSRLHHDDRHAGRRAGELADVPRSLPADARRQGLPLGAAGGHRSLQRHSRPSDSIAFPPALPRARLSGHRRSRQRARGWARFPSSASWKTSARSPRAYRATDVLVVAGTLPGRRLRDLMEACEQGELEPEDHPLAGGPPGRRQPRPDPRHRNQRPLGPRSRHARHREHRQAARRAPGDGHRRRRQHRLGNLPADRRVSTRNRWSSSAAARTASSPSSGNSATCTRRPTLHPCIADVTNRRADGADLRGASPRGRLPRRRPQARAADGSQRRRGDPQQRLRHQVRGRPGRPATA